MAKPGVMFYFNMRPSSKLSDSERLRLYDAILDYSQTGEVPEFSGTLGVVWDYMQPTLDEDNARYEATREKRAKAGALGGSAKARNPIQSSPIQFSSIQLRGIERPSRLHTQDFLLLLRKRSKRIAKKRASA